MNYRNDHDALRDRVEELERAAADASARADRAEKDLAEARRGLNDREAELRRLRGDATQPRPPSALPIALLVVLCAVGVGTLAFFRMRALATPGSVAEIPRKAGPEPVEPAEPAGPGHGGVVPAGEHLQWGFGSGPSAFPAHIGDGAVEDFVGVYRVLSDTTQTLHVGGFDGATLERRWAAGPYGTLGEGVVWTHVAVAGGRVLVTDFRSRAHVLDVKTGQELGVIELSDRARWLCPQPGGQEVWVDVADGRGVSVSLATVTAAPAPKPATCVGDFARTTCAFAHAPCAASTASAPGTHGMWTLGEGAAAVTIGVKSPGTSTPTAFAAGGRGWKTVIPEDPALAKETPFDGAGSDLGGGLFVTAYELVDRGFRLAALDAATGERRWDVPIPRSAEGSGPRGITATETRVYVPHWTWLDVFDLQTGRVIGTVGVW